MKLAAELLFHGSTFELLKLFLGFSPPRPKEGLVEFGYLDYPDGFVFELLLLLLWVVFFRIDANGSSSSLVSLLFLIFVVELYF